MRIVGLLLCLPLAACAHRDLALVNYRVDGQRCHAMVRLLDCDHASPPNCRRISAKYDKNCEMIDLTK